MEDKEKEVAPEAPVPERPKVDLVNAQLAFSIFAVIISIIALVF